MSYRAALTNPPFARMLGAHGLGTLAQLQLTMAVSVYALERTGSGVWVAVALSLSFAPYVLFSTTAGLLADRYARSAVLRWSLLLRLATATLVTAGLWWQWAPVVVVVFAAMTAVIATPSYPALAAATPQLVPQAQLPAANGLATGIENAAWVAGPGLLGLVLLAGAPVAGGGLAAVLCFVVAVVCLGGTATPVPVRGADGQADGFFAGLAEVRAHPRMRAVLLLAILDNALYGYMVVAIVLAGDLRNGPKGVGWLNSAFAVGAFLSLALAANLPTDHGVRRILAFLVGFGISAVGLAFAALLPVAIVAVLLAGMFTVIAEIAAVTELQRLASDAAAARIFGLYDTLAVGVIAVMTAMAGWLSDVVGVSAGLALVATVIATLSALVARGQRGQPRL
ncbi:MAG: MFS transporter [Candidatus Nanopelagicales bacterium]